MNRPCGHGLCGSPDTRLYAGGWRCASHTPAALAGQPEPDAARYCAPLRCHCGKCPSWDRPLEPIAANVVDFRAVASGKRRAPLATYRDAQAQVNHD